MVMLLLSLTLSFSPFCISIPSVRPKPLRAFAPAATQTPTSTRTWQPFSDGTRLRSAARGSAHSLVGTRKEAVKFTLSNRSVLMISFDLWLCDLQTVCPMAPAYLQFSSSALPTCAAARSLCRIRGASLDASTNSHGLDFSLVSFLDSNEQTDSYVFVQPSAIRPATPPTQLQHLRFSAMKLNVYPLQRDTTNQVLKVGATDVNQDFPIIVNSASTTLSFSNPPAISGFALASTSLAQFQYVTAHVSGGGLNAKMAAQVHRRPHLAVGATTMPAVTATTPLKLGQPLAVEAQVRNWRET
jgi:hypothetical protein